jgi:hypothetical protein
MGNGVDLTSEAGQVRAQTLPARQALGRGERVNTLGTCSNTKQSWGHWGWHPSRTFFLIIWQDSASKDPEKV